MDRPLTEKKEIDGVMRALITYETVANIGLVVMEAARMEAARMDHPEYGISDKQTRWIIRRLRELLVLEEIYENDVDAEEAIRLLSEQSTRQQARWQKAMAESEEADAAIS